MSARAVLLGLLAFGWASCVPLTTLPGARTLPPGQTQVSVQGSGGYIVDPRSGPGAVAGAVQVRHGLAPDVDVGFTSALGARADLRWRFLRHDRLHFAVDPGVGVHLASLPGVEIAPGLTGAGFVDIGLPVLAEWDLSARWSWTVRVQATLRSLIIVADKDAEAVQGLSRRGDVLMGAGTRIERHLPTWGFGVAFDVADQATAGWQVIASVDLFTLSPRQRRVRRALAVSAKGREPGDGP